MCTADEIVSLVDEFVNGGPWKYYKWRELSEGSLLNGLRRLVREPDLAALRRCAELLDPDQACKNIERFYLPHGGDLKKVAARIHGNARALTALAEAAALNRRITVDREAWKNMVNRLREAGGLLFPTALQANRTRIEQCDIEPCDSKCNEDERLAYALENLAKSGLPVNSLGHWLSRLRSSDSPEAQGINILGAVDESDGFIAALRFTVTGKAGGELVEDPGTALRGLTPQLIETVKQQHERHAPEFSICWGLAPKSGNVPTFLDGASLGAAAAVGFRLIASGGVYDASCAVTAEVERNGDDWKNDKLASVGGLKAKLSAVIDWNQKHPAAKIARVGLANAAPVNGQPVHELQDEFPSISLKQLDTIGNAVEFCSSAANQLKAYLRALIDEADGAKAIPGDKSVAGLYIEPDLLRWEKKPALHGNERDAPDTNEEPVYGQSRSHERERRDKWSRVRERERSVMILGVPGGGKTTLVEQTAKELAARALDELESQKAGSESIILPVRLTFEQLTGTLTGEGSKNAGESDAEAVQRAVRLALEKRGCCDLAVKHIAEHLSERRTWLFVDALDELPPGRNEALAAALRVLESWQCRLVMTSRPYGWENSKELFPPSLQNADYRLAPFSPDQIDLFVANWFDKGEKYEQLRALLRQGHSLRSLAQAPFLLQLICAITEREALSPDITSTELYGKAMAKLFKDGERANLWRRAMENLAWRLFERDPRSYYLEADELGDVLECDGPIPEGVKDPSRFKDHPTEKIQLLLEELKIKRVLIPFDDAKGYAFPHRSIAEYLMGCALARKV